MQGQWLELPSPLGKNLFFPNLADQSRMPQVCRKWSEGYSYPSVWRHFRFALTKLQLSMDACPEIKFAQKCTALLLLPLQQPIRVCVPNGEDISMHS
ncbi:hypothetical protein AVEN_75172-1 [Araneus ventricosus]|uniref:Uncharacterized protein n=1 Tax=Araneus ventricosus TaxID=182803 RepID=A0A4Y2QBV8_ARAVE|nr:hypothetical protein AVEN_75172-1 [Araneus ventricosus]